MLERNQEEDQNPEDQDMQISEALVNAIKEGEAIAASDMSVK